MLDEIFNSYQEWHTQDKSSWGEGEWQAEPDKAQWLSRRLACLITRRANGTLCGFVGVPAHHPYYQQSHENLALHAYGAVNFSGAQVVEDAHTSLEKIWWFGFSCDHACDYQPAVHAATQSLDEGSYRNIQYVMGEVETLVIQLTSLA